MVGEAVGGEAVVGEDVVASVVDGLALIDHHCHSVVAGPLTQPEFEALLGEGGAPPPGCSNADSSLGFAVRAWCAPLLDLEPGVPLEQYVARRAELGEVAGRLLSGAASTMLVDTGYRAGELASLDELAGWSGAHVREVVRLESLAEVARDAGGDYADSLAAAMAAAAQDGGVAWKSVAAYRCGLAIDWRRPSPAAVRAAAADWRHGRLEDAVLIRHGVWAALDTGRPVQLHTGYGDRDLRLASASPAHLEDLLRESAGLGTPVMMLHCWPWQREAGYLTQVWPHAYMDVGLALPHVGHNASRVLAEALELAPWHKVLYSSDAFGLAELHHLGARTWRSALTATVAPLVDMGIDHAELTRLAGLVASGNARRVYGL